MNARGQRGFDMGGGLGALAPVARETVQDRVYRHLRGGLIRGAFDAGEVFAPGDIAKRMSVSSMPVREALARLVSEQALETMPNRRVRVPLLTLARARDIAQSRTLIERDLAARAEAALDAGLLARLEALTEQYEDVEDFASATEMNHTFHFTLYARAGSTVLLPFVESLWMQAGPFVRAAARLHRPDLDASATKHHRGILEGLRSGDPDRVAAELAADIAQAFAILERRPDVWQEGGA